MEFDRIGFEVDLAGTVRDGAFSFNYVATVPDGENIRLLQHILRRP
jgi:hypothetical protein